MNTLALLGERIKKLREKSLLSQKELARLIGLEHQSHVSRIELGESSPSADVLNAIAKTFNVTTDYILSGCVAGFAHPSQSEFYMGYNVSISNAKGKEAVRFLGKCLQYIQEADAENAAEVEALKRRIYESTHPKETTESSILTDDDKDIEITRLNAEITRLEKELAEALKDKSRFCQTD